jgi:diadenosine tetraphosphatase ApaH/serine/threonine PP2A family protein phosphatase
MKMALFSDVHANLEALESVLSDARWQGCDQFACLGDIVGYAADPVACLDIVRDLECPMVRGNFDESAARKDSLEDLNPFARQHLLWTRRQLDEERCQWLGELKLVQRVSDFTLVHATLDSPGNWGYVTNDFDAMASFSYQSTQVCFYGHTHVPRIFEKGSAVRTVHGTDIALRRGMKYFINVGSVGQPRDGDWRAAYGIYDREAQTFSIRRVEYDIETTRAKIRDAGLPPAIGGF